ncbi:DUF1843 domain-containing protein [Aquimarina sediminis]|uniref:DUF1843 domain-containing protein n=1 Tax=Aquimarina sediminis TaxID=2070536 RepID=UPI000CA05CF4|nr:DUF1843 domain-containing protein [Aquimarina sediminis]
MGIMTPYGAAIREAIASNDLAKMKATAEQAKNVIKEQGDISCALIDLQEAIDKLEGKLK